MEFQELVKRKSQSCLPSTLERLLSFYEDCLNHQNSQQVLGHKIISKLKESSDLYATLLPNAEEHNLVHGDFGPENILVSKSNGIWSLSAILDWEFAFSGSSLTDVANMLRYSHKMPDIYEENFLKGLRHGGYQLPQHWKTQIYFLNILSLLDCLNRHHPEERPNQCRDIKSLIEFFVFQIDGQEVR